MSLVRPKYFSYDAVDLDYPAFSEVLGETDTKFVQIDDNHWKVECLYNGKTRYVSVTLHNEFNSQVPSVIFHHGAGETSYGVKLMGIKRIFSGCNLFTIQAQNHTSKRDYLLNCMQSFIDWTETFAGSVLAIEEILNWHRAHSNNPFIVSGGSMGGIVTSLHFFYYGNADYYLPIVAHPNVGELFLGKYYETIVDKRTERMKNKSLLSAFNIPKEVKDKADRSKITVVLGKYDPIILYSTANKFWKGFNVKAYNVGHASIVAKSQELRDIIQSKIKAF